MNLINKKQLKDFDKVYRLKLVNCLSGFKSANLIGSVSDNGKTNLAIFSSVVHLGSDPALIGFIMRPLTVPRDTYDNIKNIKQYTINHVNSDVIKNAHMTSGSWNPEESEFDKCDFEEEFIKDFKPPFVKQSKVKIGVSYVDEIHIKQNGTILIVGEIEKILIEDSILEKDGNLDLFSANSTSVCGLGSYGQVSKIIDLEYVRLNK